MEESKWTKRFLRRHFAKGIGTWKEHPLANLLLLMTIEAKCSIFCENLEKHIELFCQVRELEIYKCIIWGKFMLNSAFNNNRINLKCQNVAMGSA